MTTISHLSAVAGTDVISTATFTAPVTEAPEDPDVVQFVVIPPTGLADAVVKTYAGPPTDPYDIVRVSVGVYYARFKSATSAGGLHLYGWIGSGGATVAQDPKRVVFKANVLLDAV